MKLVTLLPLLLVLFSIHAYCSREKVDPISFGSVGLAEDRLNLKLKSFTIKNSGRLIVNANLVEDSLQWVRFDNVLLVPRAILQVSFQSEPEQDFSFNYGSQKIIPLYDPKTKLYKTAIFISIFEAIPLYLYSSNGLLSTITITPSKDAAEISQLIDYSCAPYSVELSGLEDDFVSVGCIIQRTGKFGNERPYLKMLLTSASFRLKDQSEPPYHIVFYESGAAKIKMVNFEGKEKEINISAKVPEHLPRLRLAMGLGPYTLYTKTTDDRLNQIAPTLMLYGNLGLNDSTSFRFFDSYSKNISTFHNWGTYFAWDLARFCDQRCQLTSLIGAQGVDYRFNSSSGPRSDVIYPQGFEFVYNHPFGQLNYKLSYGMFASLSGEYDYQNIWMRYGKKIFWELNYIEWKLDEESAAMFGISVGLPIASFF